MGQKSDSQETTPGTFLWVWRQALPWSDWKWPLRSQTGPWEFSKQHLLYTLFLVHKSHDHPMWQTTLWVNSGSLLFTLVSPNAVLSESSGYLFNFKKFSSPFTPCVATEDLTSPLVSLPVFCTAISQLLCLFFLIPIDDNTDILCCNHNKIHSIWKLNINENWKGKILITWYNYTMYFLWVPTYVFTGF